MGVRCAVPVRFLAVAALAGTCAWQMGEATALELLGASAVQAKEEAQDISIPYARSAVARPAAPTS
jgi:hypothetical protein